ncbi:DUF7000 family protein [Chloroflexota bacterium]
MDSLQEYMKEYRIQLGKGAIQKAYKGLMEYIMALRTHFSKNFPDFAPGNIYHGYMDMTYFPLSPKSLKSRKLKIAIVFNYDQFRFEAWLAGYNKNIQKQYWELIKESDWKEYHVVPTTRGVDSIINHVLVDNPDFNDLDTLTEQIETGTLNFIRDIENFLSEH